MWSKWVSGRIRREGAQASSYCPVLPLSCSAPPRQIPRLRLFGALTLRDVQFDLTEIQLEKMCVPKAVVERLFLARQNPHKRHSAARCEWETPPVLLLGRVRVLVWAVVVLVLVLVVAASVVVAPQGTSLLPA
jgi:hypothetical protein